MGTLIITQRVGSPLRFTPGSSHPGVKALPSRTRKQELGKRSQSWSDFLICIIHLVECFSPQQQLVAISPHLLITGVCVGVGLASRGSPHRLSHCHVSSINKLSIRCQQPPFGLFGERELGCGDLAPSFRGILKNKARGRCLPVCSSTTGLGMRRGFHWRKREKGF